MKFKSLSAFALILSFVSCAPHFHLDFLGKDTIEEIVLIPSAAKEKILIIDVTGIIGANLKTGIFTREGDSLSRIYFRLQKASQDNLIKGIVLRIDTPGGEVTACDIIHHEILNFKKKTGIPVLALMMGLGTSGGYYVASACDLIIAHPSTITGSIGVISIFPNFSLLLAKIGVSINVIKSGEMKDSGSAFREITEEEKFIFQGVIDSLYRKFLEAVERGRKGSLNLEELGKIADGRIYTAEQALQLKLIDRIGYFDTALEEILKLSSLKKAKVIAYTYYPKLKTNIYASSLENNSFLEDKNLETILPSLESGFYYLWLPQIRR